MNVRLTLFAQNSTRIELIGLEAYAGVEDVAIVNSAAVTARLLDSAGEELPGQTWPLAMTYEAGSAGNYSGVISQTLGVAVGDLVTAEVTATSAADQGFWEIPCEVERRTHRSGKG